MPFLRNGKEELTSAGLRLSDTRQAHTIFDPLRR